MSTIQDEAFEYFASPVEYFKRRRPLRGVIPTMFFGQPQFLLVGIKAHEFVHGSHKHLFSHAKGYVRFNDTFGGPHLEKQRAMIALEGDDWRVQHDLILPLFAADHLKVTLEEKRRVYEERMSQWPALKEIDVLEELHALTLASTLRGLYGIRLGEEFAEVRDLIQEMATIALITYGQPGARDRATAVHRRLTELLAPHFEEKRRCPASDGLSSYACTHAISGNPLGDDDITSCIAGQIFASFSPIRSLSTFCFYFMARYPRYAERVLREIEQVVGDEDPGYAHVGSPKKMPSLDYLVREAERMYAPLHLLSRGVLETFVFEGQEIPRGATIHVAPLATHYDPEIFKNPEAFDPDRFAPPREEDKVSPYALDTFGGGERVCMGRSLARMDIKLAIIVAFRRMHIELKSHQEVLEVLWGPTTEPKAGLKMSVRPRSNPNH